MFDPTVFENLKVVLEGAIYDRDLHGDILVENRKDIVDLATMGRTFEITFRNSNTYKSATATICLQAGIEDFSDEKIKLKENSGCSIFITFISVVEEEKKCKDMEAKLRSIWGNAPFIQQVISYQVGKEEKKRVTITLDFKRKITEDQMDDLSEMIDATIFSIDGLNNYK